MELKLYNTLTRKKEIFKPINDNLVKIYTCGPTVYNYAHIGNLRTYIFEDILKRTLLYNKFKVKHVMNITDVGHLTSDSDTGEDKIEKEAKKEKKSAWDIAEFYAKTFKEDLKELNILFPDIWCKATDHIKEQIDWIKKLEKADFTYITSDGVYFDTSKLKDYGKLAGLKKEKLKHGIRIELKEKRNPTDFALWKFSNPEEKRQMEWPSPWNPKGFPGWHIECSAMSTKYLGEQFDIHCGGIDHIPVHHTNEIAQTEAITKKKWVNFWLHGEFLLIGKEKVSKSLGNFITLQNLIDKNYDPLIYRYFCLNAHYKSQLPFTLEALDSAKNSYNRLKEIILTLKKESKTSKNINKKYQLQFHKAINNDLDMPKALSVLWNVLRDKNLKPEETLSLIYDFDKVFGLNLKELESEIKISKGLLELAEKRELARKNKDFKSADKLREEIKNKGYSIEDSPKGLIWKKI